MNKYLELHERQQAEIEAFPMFFAFNNKQFDEGMRSLGLQPDEVGKIYSIGAGGFIRKTDSAALHEMLGRHSAEMQAAVDADETGEGFIFDMFNYELANHEYGYTHDPEPTLECLGLTMEMVKADARLLHGWRKATRYR